MTRKVMVGPRSGDASYSAGGLASGSQPLGPTAKAWTVPPRSHYFKLLVTQCLAAGYT